jgi:hypothetical protein
MTGHDPEALVRAVAEQEIPAEPREVREARRERMVAAVGRAIRQSGAERERRTRLRRRIAAFGAAAAVALGAFGAHRIVVGERATVRHDAHTAVSSVAMVEDVTGTLVVTHAGRARVVSPGERPQLTAGDELRTATDGGAKVKTERSSVAVASATELRVLAPSLAEERIRLAFGRVDLHVAKQAKVPRSVVVETPDTEVVVRGTVFSVAVSEEGGVTNTRVRVTEGSVWVLAAGSREIVSTGEEWSSIAARKSMPAPLPAPPSAVASVANTPRQETRRAPAPLKAQSATVSTLAEENKMFDAAIGARNRGDDRRAIELFGALIGRFPKGRLAEEARVERLRAMRRLGDNTRASAEARRYLSEFGNGFAREEAREAALGGK